MAERIFRALVLFWLTASLAGAASFDRARELYLSGDVDGARSELHELLAEDGDAAVLADALKLLGQLEVDQKNWQAALDAWADLTDDHALSPQAAAVSPTIRLLQALVECACDPGEPAAVTAAREEPPVAATEPIASQPDTAPAPPPTPMPTPPSTPAAPEVEPATGLILVGGWGVEYEASQEAARDLIEFLGANGVGVRAGSTDVAAIRGVEVVLSELIDEARRAGADGVLLLTSRFDFREYIEIARYDLDGNRLWKEKTTGGTALKERHERGKPSWGLVERAKKRLAKRIGSPDLPVR